MNPSATRLEVSDVRRSAEIRKLFRDLYGTDCRLFRAPGRINLIGEHTDYNDGFVMPAAIDLQCWAAIAPARDRTVAVYSSNFSESRSFDLDQPQPRGDWSDYVQGAATILEKFGYRFPGARMLISSDVPLGSGLSSSAALEVAAALALLDTQPGSCDPAQLAQICRRAENEFVGARCGIMDQFVSSNGRAGHLLMLDCRSLEYRLLPVPDDARLVICNTMVKHAIAAGEYNVRRAQCEEGVRLLSRVLPGVSALRDVSPDDLDRFRDLLAAPIYKRCRHVVAENHRVLVAAASLERNDLQCFGKLMAGSHKSLRDDFEVSCRELDLMVELASAIEGVHGARMTGGGFGGCTVNVVAADAVAEFVNRIAPAYEARTGITPEIHVSAASEGAGRYDA